MLEDRSLIYHDLHHVIEHEVPKESSVGTRMDATLVGLEN